MCSLVDIFLQVGIFFFFARMYVYAPCVYLVPVCMCMCLVFIWCLHICLCTFSVSGAHMYVHAPYVCLVTEVRRGYLSSKNYFCEWLWMLGPLEEQPVLLTTESSLQPTVINFFFLRQDFSV